ncbi:unnamed protein product [Euphydryas editha]|nr:unnamed protein product [Euphydryas editha]
MLRLYEEEAKCNMDSQVFDKPDLMGITQMIRMVEQFDEKPSNESYNDVPKLIATNTLLSITKLNPNVPDFVPNNVDTVHLNKNSETEVCLNENVNTGRDQNCIVSGTPMNEKEIDDVKQLNNSKNIKDIKEINKADNVSGSSSRIDTSRLTEVEMKEMREKLKDKILKTSNEKCVKVKRERNLAIATLVKLHCKPATSDINTPKLIGPEYYETKLSENVSSSSIAPSKSENTTDSSTVSKRFEHLVNNNSTESNVVDNKIKDDAEISKHFITKNNEEPSTSTVSVKDSSDNAIPKEVKDSIEKVEDWLNNPKKVSKSPVLYLGPVTFKRKVKSNNSKTISPISTNSENTGSVVYKTETFVPSELASQLAKEYSERKKAKQIVEQQQQNIWTKLELELKAKDEIIRNRLKMSSSSLNTTESS